MSNTGLAIFAVVVAMGLFAVIALDTLMTIKEAEGAQSVIGQCASSFRNSSAQFCHNFR